MTKANSLSQNASLGYVFLMSGIVMSITIGWIVGMSFLMTGFVFLVLGLTSAGEASGQDRAKSD